MQRTKVDLLPGLALGGGKEGGEAFPLHGDGLIFLLADHLQHGGKRAGGALHPHGGKDQTGGDGALSAAGQQAEHKGQQQDKKAAKRHGGPPK